MASIIAATCAAILLDTDIRSEPHSRSERTQEKRRADQKSVARVSDLEIGLQHDSISLLHINELQRCFFTAHVGEGESQDGRRLFLDEVGIRDLESAPRPHGKAHPIEQQECT